MSLRDRQIRLEVFNPRSSSLIEPILATVDDGVEFNLPDNLIDVNIDVAEESIQLDFSNAGSGSSAESTFNGYVFSILSEDVPPIADVTIDSSVTNLGIKDSDIVFSDNTIEIDVEGLSYNENSQAKFDLEFGETENVGFLGSQIEYEGFSPTRSQSISNKVVATVNNGYEFTRLSDSSTSGNSVGVNVDFTAENILFDFSDATEYTSFAEGTFNGYVFSDIGETIPPIKNVTVDPSATTLGLADSDITFTEDRIEINVAELSFNTETTAKFDIEFGEIESVGFLGNQIQRRSFSPRDTAISETDVSTVNNGFEFTRSPDSSLEDTNIVDVNIDIGADYILYEFIDAGSGSFLESSFNGSVFSDIAGTIPPITNVTIDRTATTLGLDDSDVSFDENNIEINVEGLSFDSSTTALFNVEFQEEEPPEQSPEEEPPDEEPPEPPPEEETPELPPEKEPPGENPPEQPPLEEETPKEPLPPLEEGRPGEPSENPEQDPTDNPTDEPENDLPDESNVIELFRFRNTGFDTGTYVFVGEQERDDILDEESLSNTFSLDGVGEDDIVNPAFRASLASGEDLISFYRLKSVEVPGTFLFVSDAEYDTIFAEDSEQRDKWEKEGLDEAGEEDVPEFYLLDGSASQGIEFNRFQNTQNGTFLYAGPAETEAIENNSSLSDLFTNQGVAFKSLADD